MSSPYAVKCISGPQAGEWYKRRGCIIRLTRAKAAALAGKLNEMGGMWFATRYKKD